MRRLLLLVLVAVLCSLVTSDVLAHCINDPVEADRARGDSDGDGVRNAVDKCWNTPVGAKVNQDGCSGPAAAAAPADSDGDGVADASDKCADTPKGAKVDGSGCTMVAAAAPPADSDGDGVADAADKCAGTPAGTKVGGDGCPAAAAAPADSDGDGVVDSADKCADTPKGAKVDNSGCTMVAVATAPADADGDGVADASDQCPDTPKGKMVGRDGCITEKISMSLDVKFDSGKTAIKPQYHDDIKRIADFMKAHPETTAVIEGHSDNIGSDDSNVRLSTRRAESVRKYMIDNFGVAPDRLTAKGFGPSRPIADNATVDGRAKNRRIEAAIEAIAKR